MVLEEYRRVACRRCLPAFVRSSRATAPGSDSASLLDFKIELAEQMLRRCTLCERRCGVDRIAGERGFCGVGEESRFFFEQVLWGEEKPLVPSHEVFFSGCNMRCKYCYSWESVENPERGKAVIPAEFARLVDLRSGEGAVNLNLIGGEPTVNLLSILRVLREVSARTAVVWNSNFYMSEETMSLLDGVVDLYVGDFRFGNEHCAREIGRTERYVEAARRNFLLAAQGGGLIIRHLVLPGHVDCCLRPIAEWVAEHLPGAPFNLMFQYLPCSEALRDQQLCRTVSDEEEKSAREIVTSLGLNTESWNKPLRGVVKPEGNSSGEKTTTITILPDGRVSIMHLHGELLRLVEALELGQGSVADLSS